MEFLSFAHSLLRYLLLLAVAFAGITHLLGWLRNTPILNGERSAAILAMVLCHVQLVVGIVMYIVYAKHTADASDPAGRYWKFEHATMMLVVIALVTLGRSLSKRAKEERLKQRHVAVFYLIALMLMLVTIPWPGSHFGDVTGITSWL
ncbi:MAG: hypothetical protein RBT71_00550 [Flavobacteriales bacterium]|jgi:cell division protein FtsW (lipid II flippase)|nr:hypothetical protein [Flavobacteriales bacterium]